MSKANQRKSPKIALILLISSFSAINILSTPVLAISQSRLNFYAENNILFYDGDNSCTSISVGTYDGDKTAGLSELQSAFVDEYHDIAEQLSIEYGIPWETVMAQGILESASGTSTFATERNNFFGIGAYDSNPDNAFSYGSPEEGWRGYYENIATTPTYRAHGVFQGDAITDPYVYAQAIKDAGYATDPNYVSKLETLIAAIEERAEVKGWLSSAELAEKYPEMLSNAASYASGDDVQNSASQSSYCSVSDNSSLNSTALLLSWPERGHDPWDDPKPEYTTALAETGVNKLGDKCSMNGNSCDAFVATVLRYAENGDPNVPCCGAANLLNYFSNSSLYEEIENTGSTDNLQPGDIRSSAEHVEMIVVDTDGSYKIASASHCDRTADHGIGFYSDSSYRIFRLKGNN